LDVGAARHCHRRTGHPCRPQAVALVAAEHRAGISAAGLVIPGLLLRNEREKIYNEREKAYRESDICRARMETDAILAARVPPPVADELNRYVSRCELEAALETYLQQPRSEAGAYLVVYGARGAGKSTLARLAQATQPRCPTTTSGKSFGA
jgi:hypothetical protein